MNRLMNLSGMIMSELSHTRLAQTVTGLASGGEQDSLHASSNTGDAMKTTVEQIWNEFSGRLGQFIRGRVSDPALAEDILQDVFVKFQGRVEEMRDRTKVQGWLFLVARNAIIDHYRTRKPTAELTESLPAESSRAFGMEELHAVFRQLIESLPEPYREAVVLTDYEGLTQGELARRLGISLSGAKSRVQRGREQLKQLLLDWCQREFRHTPGVSPCPKGLVPPLEQNGATGRKNPATRRPKSNP